jgi:hypothetical protein
VRDAPAFALRVRVENRHMGVRQVLPGRAPKRSATAADPTVVRRRVRGNDAVLALQQTAGNRATAGLLQRAPTPLAPPKTPAPRVDDAAAARDYADALKYVDDFYEGVHFAVEQVDKVREAAQDNYVAFGELKDPPSLGEAVFKALVSSVLGMVPVGALITRAYEFGLFARELGKLKVELEATPIPGYSVADAEKAGPSAATTKKAAKDVGYAKTAWDTGAKVYDAVVETLAQQRAAAAAEAKALELAGLSQQRISDWSQATALAQKEELTVTGWIQHAGPDTKLRGVMKAAVERSLGPIPIIDTAQVALLTKKYELELYRAKYKTARYVATIIMSPWGDSAPSRPELRVSGDLSKPTRARIAYCAGVGGTDDATMAGVLGIAVTTEKMMNPGLRRPGEI